MSISVSNLTKTFGSQKAVNNISFQVNSGEIVGFLGPNGAGKSTTMKMIAGYITADGGKIEVCGESVVENSSNTKKKIGYLPEANPLYFDMYVREYLNFIAEIHQIDEKKERVKAVIELVGLNKEVNKKIGQLSKGYKQRVGLAAALIHDPEVLILDEPTSGLDPNQIIEIREVIKNLGATKTILFSSHIMQEVEAICNRVLIIHKGQIVADDLVNSLQLNNSSNHYVTIQFKEVVSLDMLQNLKEVVSIKDFPKSTFTIETTHPEVMRRQLLELSIERDINIISLNSEKQNLEQIFKTLTN